MQIEIQRRYSQGFGFQFFYVLSNAFRPGGNGWSEDFVQEGTCFWPAPFPAICKKTAHPEPDESLLFLSGESAVIRTDSNGGIITPKPICFPGERPYVSREVLICLP
jgi:hypothetical protein